MYVQNGLDDDDFKDELTAALVKANTSYPIFGTSIYSIQNQVGVVLYKCKQIY
jgi:hypothetical protein